MSRLISGAAGLPDLLRTQQAGMRVIRGTTGGVTSAWITFEQITGSNEYKLSGHTNVTSPEFEIQFSSGQYTVSSLADAVTGQVSGSKWAANVIGAFSDVDAVQLVQTPNAPCLGSSATYTSVPADSPNTRRLFVISTSTLTITPNDISSLKISRMRFGMQGHQIASPTLGKDVLAGDECLTAALRAVDLGNTHEIEDYLTCTFSYPNSSHVAFTSTLGLSQGNGLAISEMGLFSAGDHLCARKTFGQVNKSNSFSILAVWTLIF